MRHILKTSALVLAAGAAFVASTQAQTRGTYRTLPKGYPPSVYVTNPKAITPAMKAKKYGSYVLDRGLNAAVLAYAKSRLGQQVGDGECWALVDAALTAAGAHRPGTDGYGPYVFGNVVSSAVPGDVMQFEGAYFYHKDANGWSEMNLPHHTAIVASVKGQVITVLNQNVNGDRTVQDSTLNLVELQRGTVTIYRPQPK